MAIVPTARARLPPRIAGAAAGVAALAVLSGAPRAGSPVPVAQASRDVVERAYRANNIGVAWLEQFDFAKAATSFRDALRLAPSLPLARFNLAVALFYEGAHAAAEREARAAAAAMDGSPSPPYLLALIARAQGRPDEAAGELARVLAIDRDDPGANILLAQIRLEKGDARGAIARFETALAGEPHNATAAYGLAISLTRTGREDEGRRMLARYQTIRESGAATTLGSGYLEQGRYAAGIASTGAEPEVVDRTVPDTRFVEEAPLDRATPVEVSPVGRRFRPGELNSAGRRRIAAALAGGIALVDVDADGDLDLLDIGVSGERLWRNSAGRLDPAGGLPGRRAGAAGMGAVAGDYNNDGRPDLLVLRYGGTALYRNEGAGRWTDVTTAAGLHASPTALPLSAAFCDLDHDGDLDIVFPGYVDLALVDAAAPATFPAEFPPLATKILRNNGDGTFVDLTDRSGVSPSRVIAVVPTDFDNGREVDLILAGDAGRVALFRNLRDGSFKDIAQDAGLTSAGRLDGIAVADLNRDGRPDFLFARADGPAVLASSSGRALFRTGRAPTGAATLLAAQLFDYDNDGLTDLFGWTPDGARLLRNAGGLWQDVTERALPRTLSTATLPRIAAGRAIAVADIDGDGDQDLLVRRDGAVRLLRNTGGERAGGLRVRLSARVSNRSAAGAKVEMRAGSLRQYRELYAATPPPAPIDVVFGLGGRPAVDAARVLWPAGIVQAEVDPSPTKPLLIKELDRKPSSCPYLFAWNGRRFEFITDFLGGGELGYWVAPGVRSQPDSDEYVRLPPYALAPHDGRYELRITNELEEVLYLDHVRLEVVEHRAGHEIHPNEGLAGPPFRSHQLYAVSDLRPVASATDDRGRDMRAEVAALDGRAPDGFALTAIRGYAAPHALTIGVGRGSDVLLLSGWTDYAFSADNVAAWQRGLRLTAPMLQVRDATGRWRSVGVDIGIPVGRPQTLVVDLRDPRLGDARELRIATNMRIYWDRIAAASASGQLPMSRHTLDTRTARLQWRGFSAELADGGGPRRYDHARVSAVSPWKTMTGRYTAEGDVRALLAAVDDRFVVARPGDEIVLAFDAAGLAPPPRGWTRTFLVYADGFSKEMDLHSASPDQVAPLPFHGMRGYPPEAGAGPDGDGADLARTRPAPAQVQSIDSFLLLAKRH